MLASTHGRFTTSDTYEPSMFNPTSFNRYTHVENDPTQKIDPTGLKSSIVYGIAVHAKSLANWVPLGSNRVPDRSTRGSCVTATQSGLLTAFRARYPGPRVWLAPT